MSVAVVRTDVTVTICTSYVVPEVRLENVWVPELGQADIVVAAPGHASPATRIRNSYPTHVAPPNPAGSSHDTTSDALLATTETF
jgi:hypothetical protein